MHRFLLAAALLLPIAAMAQPAQPAPDELVLIPRAVAQGTANWIMNPDATSAVRLYAAMTACLKDNPSGGIIVRTGQDFCSEVTAAIDARTKEVSDLKKQVDDAKAAADKAAKDGKAALDKAVSDQKSADEKDAVAQVTEAKRIMQERIDTLEKGK